MNKQSIKQWQKWISVGLIVVLFISMMPIIPNQSEASTIEPITIAQGDSDLAINDVFDASFWNIGHNASINSDRIQLTPAANNQKGFAYFKDSIRLSEDLSFNAKYTFNISDSDYAGADGIAFVIQSESNTAGAEGEGMGYSDISPSVVVEIDTYENPGIDPSESHIAIMKNGDYTDHIASENLGDIDQNTNLYSVWIDYADGNMKVYFAEDSSGTTSKPAEPHLNQSINLQDIFGDTQDVFVGFSSATGGSYSKHEILGVFFDSEYTSAGIEENDKYQQAPKPDAPLAMAVSKTKDEAITVIPEEGKDYVFYEDEAAIKPIGSGSSFTIDASMNTDGKSYYYSIIENGVQSDRAYIEVLIDDEVAEEDTGIKTSDGVTNYTSGVVIDQSLEIEMENYETLDHATVVISGFELGDKLGFSNQHDIFGSYNEENGVLTLSGEATVEQYEDALQSITFETTATASKQRQISFTIGKALYFDPTQHFYEFVKAEGITWHDAKDAASGKSFYGRQGYLATVTSEQENNFVTEKSRGAGWLGANDENSEGVWEWVTGPETGQQFWQGDGSGEITNDLYENWYVNTWSEPNNGDGNGEDYLHIFGYDHKYSSWATNAIGYWNDFAAETTVDGYLVEYGGLSTDTVEQIQVTDDKIIKLSDSGNHVEIENGTGSGIYQTGTTVTIEAYTPHEGQQFKEWQVTSENVELADSNSIETTFTMPTEAVKVIAIYEAIPTYELNIVDGSGSGEYPAGKEIEITANEDVENGKKFVEWQITSGEVALANVSDPNTTFTMPKESVTIEAIYSYAVTIENGSGTDDYQPGETVTIEADKAPEGQKFKEWQVISENLILIDSSLSEITFTMPSESITVSAIYEQMTEKEIKDQLNEAANALTIDTAFEFSEDDTWESITLEFLMLTVGMHETAIDWESSNPNVIAVEGNKATTFRQAKDESVILTATITKAGYSVEKTFLLIVKSNQIANKSSESVKREATIDSDQIDSKSNLIERINLFDSNNKVINKIDKIIIDEELISTESKQDFSVYLPDDTKDLADELAVEIRSAALKKVLGNLEVKTDQAIIQINKDEIERLNELGLDLFFRVVPLRDKLAQDGVKERMQKDKSLQSIVSSINEKGNIKILGIPKEIETNYSGYQTDITLPLGEFYHDIMDLDNIHVYIEHSDGTIDIQKGTIIYENDVPVGYKFSIDKFSTFTLFEVEDDLTTDPTDMDDTENDQNSTDGTNGTQVNEDSKDVVTSQEQQTSTNSEEENQLPITASNMFRYMMIGLLLLGVGVMIYRYQRRRQEN